MVTSIESAVLKFAVSARSLAFGRIFQLMDLGLAEKNDKPIVRPVTDAPDTA